MKQTSFSELEYAGKKKQTRRDLFLSTLEAVVPWTALVAEIEGDYPKAAADRRSAASACCG